LLESIPEKAYALASENPAWTIGEVLYHMIVAPRFLIKDVKMILGQNWLYRLVPIIIPRKFFDWLNKHLTRYGARTVSRGSLSVEYAKAHEAALKALTSVDDQDFEKSLYYPDWDPLLTGKVNLAKLFHYIKLHFDSHSQELLSIVKNIRD
jgi:hypothetical protein